ncbi:MULTISPECIES: DNA N-6-adenine-methyltransferase [Bacillus amyloliquefaciens group]|uniref:DNA N-6-adenine-methyltransferase n=1 Tax=Bacillus amyloliquefaciens group TaxID=1938374 RepID=UPI00073CBF23|nr:MULTISPECIES: DNA N-6-adenine-methyltransferase [Bacillus amyloliquefaciens group]KTF59858.1 DNA methyltransferase [Bacillus amyloliquefaciens]
MFKDNPDFYPTPTQLIRKMTSKIEWKYIKSVLEPSAGKGDLVEAIHNQFKYTKNYRRNSKYDIDTIEQDENLRHILEGKDYRVIADDFLTFRTYKKYDLVFMNPPFSRGVQHLLKAIELIEKQQRSGQIVCLLNAETLKNPYSNDRKFLIRKLEEINAEVEYIQNAFLNSERSTDVETAVIYITLENQEYRSVLMEELKKDESHRVNDDYKATQLVDADFIKGIVEQFNYEIKAGLKLINEYNSLKPLMLRSFNDNSTPILRLHIDNNSEENDIENAYIKQIRAKYWSTLFNNDQFMSLFTSNLKQKYLQHVEELKDYDFSLFNIYTLRIQMSKEMTQGVEDTILNLFEEFSHKHYYDESSKNVHLYNGWKTNKSYKINKKVIIPLNVYSWLEGRYNPTDYKVLEKLKDIEKVFNYLDNGLTEDINIDETLKLAEHYGNTKKIELKYFYVTFYKKGTCHIEFKDMEILKKFNIFGSQKKNWLPPSYGKVKYQDMTEEEKDVINDFEGAKSYSDTVNNASYYILDTSKLLMLTS